VQVLHGSKPIQLVKGKVKAMTKHDIMVEMIWFLNNNMIIVHKNVDVHFFANA
jgi:hypothetical protein